MYKCIQKTILAAIVFGGSVHTAVAGVVASQIAERQVTTTSETGEKVVSFETADLVAPGEVVRFTIKYENQEALSADNIVLVMPIPKEMIYLDSDDFGGGQELLFSYDGGVNYLAEGEYPPATYEGVITVTHLKWSFSEPVEAGETGKVSATARLK